MKRAVCLILLAAFCLCGTAGCAVVRDCVDFAAVSNTKKVMQETLLGSTEQTLSVFLAKNEYEGMQFVLRNNGAPFTINSVEISDLYCEEEVLPSSEIEIYRQHYIKIDKLFCDEFDAGFYPDALIPMKYVSNSRVEAGQNQGFWLTVHAPASQKPGLYHGSLKITYNQTKTIEADVFATVWDITIPTKINAASIFGMWDVYHYSGQLQQYTEFFKKYRLNAEQYYVQYTSLEQYLTEIEPYATDETITEIPFPCSYTKDENGDYHIAQWCIALAQALEDKGWSKKFKISLVDEPSPDNYDELIKMHTATKRDIPQIQHLQTITTDYIPSSLLPYVNSWCIKNKAVNENQIKQLAQQGTTVWWYNCNFPTYPAPTLHVTDYQQSARVNTWMQKDYNIYGFLYWASTIAFKWVDGKPPRDQWNDAYVDDAAPAGDGYLVYQGYVGDGIINENVPIPTLRLESLRDGFEDYELLLLMENKIKAFSEKTGRSIDVDAAMQHYYDAVYKSSTSYYTDNEKLDAVRKILAADIQRTAPYICFTESLEGCENIRTRKIVVCTTAEKATINNVTVAAQNGIAETTVFVDDTKLLNEYTVNVDGVETTVFVVPRRPLSNDLLTDFTKLEATGAVTTDGKSMQIDFSAAKRVYVSGDVFLQNDWTGKTHLRFTFETPNGADTKPITMSVYVGSSAIQIELPAYKSGSVIDVEIPAEIKNSIRASNITKIAFIATDAFTLWVSDMRILEKE